MRIGILTGGGDCPGLNPAIRAAAIQAFAYGWEVLGIQEGWRGMVEGIAEPLTRSNVDDLIKRGGTMLGSSRTNPYKKDEDRQRVLANFDRLGIDALIALGGEDTLGVANKLHKDGRNVVGVPKTMDNDLSGTDYTFGFDSAVAVAVDGAERLKDTAESHRRLMVYEVMGRHAGWVALHTGMAIGADWIMIPEVIPDLDEVAEHLKRKRAGGQKSFIVVVSEGIQLPQVEFGPQELDAFGHMILRDRSVSQIVAKELEAKTGFETRTANIGHIQRGGAPTVFDRILATKVGAKAAQLVHEGRFGLMTGIRGTEVITVPLAEAVGSLKTVPLEEYELAKLFF